MNNIMQTVLAYLAEEKIAYRQLETHPVFSASVSLRAGDVMLACECREEQEQVVVSVVFPFSTAPRHRMNVVEFVGMTNHRLAVGAFVMDFTDGELSFRSGIDLHQTCLTINLVRSLVDCCLSTGERFYATLAAVAVGGMPPHQAFTMLEQQQRHFDDLLELVARRGLAVDLRDRIN